MPKIVVIDDSKLMRDLLRHLLEKAGHEVDAWDSVTASSLAARVEVSQPDLLITDYQMPGCNGLTVVRLVRRTAPQLPVLVLTAYHDAAVLDALRGQGVAAILHKPLREADLLAAVGQALAH